VQFRCDLLVNLPPLFGRVGILSKVPQVAATRYDVGIVNRLQQNRNASRFVLAVTVGGDEDLKISLLGIGKGRYQCRAVAAIMPVPDHANVPLSRKQLSRSVGRAIVDDENFRAVATYL